MTSRKITPIFVACFISLGLILFAVTKDKWTFAKGDNVYQAEHNGTSIIQLAVEKAIDASAEKDTDGDGIKDWEESFKKTAPASNQNTKDTSDEPKTKTDEISRNLFSEYLQLKKSGKLNQDTMTNLVNKAVAEASANNTNFYSPSDIKTISDSDILGAKNYANAVVIVREKYRDLYKQNQIIIVGKKINFDDPASVESIAAASKLYESTGKEMAKLLVPKSLVASHVALINGYMASAEGLGELARLKTDPILGLVGIQKHTDAVKQEPEILLGISQFYINHAITFAPSDAGSRLTNI